MKMQIESTEDVVLFDGVECRRWSGSTEAGVPCDVYVHRIGVHNSADGSQFEAELLAKEPPQRGEFVPLAKRQALHEWLETKFREAINVDENVAASAAVMVAAVEAGNDPIVAVRRCIASFVIALINPTLFDKEPTDANGVNRQDAEDAKV